MKYAITLVALVLLAVFFGFVLNSTAEKPNGGTLNGDYKTIPYYISNAPVQLGAGGVEYFGNEVRGDLDGDGDEDIAFLITQETGGSGTFFFLVGAINEGGKYRGSHAMLIGDRIAPQTTEYRRLDDPYGPRVIVNYADRLPGEPFTTRPSMGTSLYAKYSPKTHDFGMVVQDFEGETRDVVH